MIKNKSSLLPLYGNINNITKSISENKKIISYKNIFNKNILWVKLYDNYIYNFIKKNTNNKFSILEPKTNIVDHVSPINTKTGAFASLTQHAAKDDNKILINKNIIKLFNLNASSNSVPNNGATLATHFNSKDSKGGCANTNIGAALLCGAGGHNKKEIKIYKYINSISEFKNEIVKYQNIVYQFNKNNKGIQNISVGINKNVFKLLEYTFLSMSSLISKPIIVFTPNKVIIQLFYYLNNSPSNLLNINNDKLQFLCLNLSKIYKKPVELELDRLHYPYYDSNILSNMIGLISNIVKLRFIIKYLFSIAKIKKTNKFSNSSSIIPSYLSGLKIRVAGRLLTQRVIPRLTVKTLQRGTLARGKAQFVDSSRFTHKNKRGSFSITVTMGHVFF